MSQMGPILQGAGGMIQMAGEVHEGQAAENAAKYNASVAEHNANLSIHQSAEEERRQRVMAKRQLGDMRASYGASGVQLDGSALDVLEDSAANAELDALTIRHGGQVKASNFLNEASLERFKGRMMKEQAYLKATGTLLETGAKAAPSGGGGKAPK